MAILAYVVPRFVLKIQANRRLNRIETGLPDVLDLIRMCLTGGLSLRDSLERVAREIEVFHPDLAVELEVIRRHAEADTMAKALKEFSRRMKTPDVSALASLVSQTERLGTHVAQAVMEFADGVRRQHRQRAEERAGKTSIRMLFPVIFCLAPPVFILLLGPPAIQLKNFFRDSKRPGGVLNMDTYREVNRAADDATSTPD
jgi:tight adherence protein C